jgi:alanine dehydrogenase
MLLINNEDVARLLTMAKTIDALEDAYRQHVLREAVCRPRIDIHIPTKDPNKAYRWGTMEGGSSSGYFAIRMKSDIIFEQEYNGVTTREKYCTKPGTYCGLVFLTSVDTGEPLAFLNDGVLQHMRVGADGGLGVKYAARQDAEVVGMLGSGGQARTHMAAFMHVRPGIKRLQVFSPTRSNCERFAAEMIDNYGIEVVVCDRPEQIYRGANIVAAVTDSAVSVLDGELIEPGTHVLNVGGGGTPGESVAKRIDVYFRFGDAPAPWGLPELGLPDEYITYAAEPASGAGPKLKHSGKRGHGPLLPDRMITFADLIQRELPSARTGADQITYSERGNLQGHQFWAVSGRIYEEARALGLGRELPTEWFLQNIRN